MQLLLGFIFASLIGVLAWRARALSRSGALGAAVTGGLIFGLGSWPWAVLLLTFFISSSALSKAFARRKAALSEKFSKGSQRDWAQVLANGGLGAFLAILHTLRPEQAWIWVAYAGAMAAVNADTWATELGVLNPTPPRLITNGKPVERGASGAISSLGSLSALGGAALVGILAAIFSYWMLQMGRASLIVLVASVLGGLFGAMFDSFLGASVQSIYYCPNCKKETERYPRHLCGAQTTPLRGWRWLNNDWVNFSASVAGALVATLIFLL